MMESPAARCTRASRDDGLVSVDMGEPNFDPAPLCRWMRAPRGAHLLLEVDGEDVEIGAVSMGNPHAVLRVSDVETAPVARLGPSIERHPRFPQRANVGFMQIVGPRPHSIARVRARRGRDAGLRHGRLRRGRGRPAPRIAGRGSAGRFAGRHGDGFLGGSGRAHVADGPGDDGFYGIDRYLT